jgi:hypothetical protein
MVGKYQEEDVVSLEERFLVVVSVASAVVECDDVVSNC